MVTPTIGVLALQGAVSEHIRTLTESGAVARRVKTVDELSGLDGLVIPGGESTTMARLAQPSGLLPRIGQRYREGMALFGTCAGLILMADEISDAAALTGYDRIGGLKVRVRRNAYGGQLQSHQQQLQLRGDSQPLPAVFIRAPQIEEIQGEDVEVLAQSSGLPVVVRQDRMLAASFHPELTGDRRLHELFVTMAAQQHREMQVT